MNKKLEEIRDEVAEGRDYMFEGTVPYQNGFDACDKLYAPLVALFKETDCLTERVQTAVESIRIHSNDCPKCKALKQLGELDEKV